MLHKKQMLALMLSISTAAVNADQLQDALNAVKQIDVKKLEKTLINKAQNEWQPALKNFAQMVQNGEFDKIASVLAIDLTPAVNFLQKNMTTIRNAFEQVLMEAESKIPFEEIPQYETRVKAALKEAKNNLNLMNKFSPYLNTLKSYAKLSQYKNVIANALKQAANSSEAQAIRDAVSEFKESLTPFVEQVATINAQALKDAVNAAPKLISAIQKNEELDMDALAQVSKGFGELRKKLAPAIPALIEGLSQVSLKLNDIFAQQGTVEKLPKEVREALDYLQENAAAVKDALHAINTEINNAVASLQQ